MTIDEFAVRRRSGSRSGRDRTVYLVVSYFVSFWVVKKHRDYSALNNYLGIKKASRLGLLLNIFIKNFVSISV